MRWTDMNAGFRGGFWYEEMWAQQTPTAFDVFKVFLEKVKPRRVLEIGTADGALTLFLRSVLTEMEIETFDMQERGSYNRLRENNISVNLLNIVGPEACPKAKEYIQEEGTSLVLCDGGNKVWEFEVLAPFLKSGDFIMAHDYVEDWDRDYEHFFDKIWNWAEVEEKHIAECCQQNNLKPYMQEQFREAAWACRQKEQ